MRIVSVKQVVGKGKESADEGPWGIVSLCASRGEGGLGKEKTYEAFWSDAAECHGLFGDGRVRC